MFSPESLSAQRRVQTEGTNRNRRRNWGWSRLRLFLCVGVDEDGSRSPSIYQQVENVISILSYFV